MHQRIHAIFEDGVFRPQQPVDIANGQHVSLNVESEGIPMGDLSDVADLLDVEFMESCRQQAGRAPSLEEVQQTLKVFQGSLAERISEERDER